MDISALTNVSSDYVAKQYEASKLTPFAEENKDFSSVRRAVLCPCGIHIGHIFRNDICSEPLSRHS